MANSSNYRVQLRRRREGKTDYQARKALVISGRPRLVTRPSIKNSTAQIIIAKPIGDQTVAAANSRELIKKYGWKAPTGNIPAAYLTGLLCGLKAKAAGIDSAILDIGLITPTKGAKIFALLHGVVDAGVEVPHGNEKIVAGRSKGDHIAQYAKELSADEDEVYAAKFSKYTAEGVAPEGIADHFSKVRAAIVASFKGAQVAPEPQSAPEPKAKLKAAPKPEAKVAPKVEVVPVAPKVEVKAVEAPKVSESEAEVKAIPASKVEAKASKVEVAKSEAKVAKEKASKAEEEPKKASKAKVAPAKETSKKAEKVPDKAKVTKDKAPVKEKGASKKKPPAKKASAKAVAKPKKGEKKE
jgi:large subunit ribosomal protein L18